jgi:twitching motility protein PilT
MNLESLVGQAHGLGASDLHLEVGQPATVRVRGTLKALEARPDRQALNAMARELLGEDGWQAFEAQRSADLSAVVAQVRCRINILHSTRGVGLAVRLLQGVLPTLASLNLHPDLARLATMDHGLILVTGPTGSGKSSTLAALLQHLNTTVSRHIVTLEHPVEYVLRPQRCFIRQREVGRDTPSFEQGLLDSLREDPDVLVVGEMRDPNTMRLTLNAAETGHLVLATMHSASGAEALQRVVGSFPSDIQPSVCAQLADCLVAVVAQRLRFREGPGLRVPELEIMTASTAARAVVRAGQFFKLQSVLEGGAADGHWTFNRYRDHLDRKTDFVTPPPPDVSLDDAAAPAPARPAVAPKVARPLASAPVVARPTPSPPAAATPGRPTAPPSPDRVLVLDEEGEDNPADILAALERRGR